MEETEQGRCLVCLKHRGQTEFLPGGAIYEDRLVFAAHAANVEQPGERVYLGWLIIEPKRHAAGLGDLDDDEAERLGLVSARLASALRATERAEHVYLFVLGHHVDHLHIHLVPRYHGTPREYWGLRVAEWPGAPRGREDEVLVVSERIRHHLRTPAGSIGPR